jgi:hypothetical protein
MAHSLRAMGAVTNAVKPGETSHTGSRGDERRVGQHQEQRIPACVDVGFDGYLL